MQTDVVQSVFSVASVLQLLPKSKQSLNQNGAVGVLKAGARVLRSGGLSGKLDGSSCHQNETVWTTRPASIHGREYNTVKNEYEIARNFCDGGGQTKEQKRCVGGFDGIIFIR